MKTILDNMPFGKLIQGAIAFAKHLWDMDLFEEGKKLLSSLWNGMKNIWGSISTWFKGEFSSLMDLVPDWLLPDGAGPASTRGTAAAAAATPRSATRPTLEEALAKVRSDKGMAPWKDGGGKADVTVAFKNAPPGTRVSGKADKGIGLTVDTGYSMAY
jgi:hypothetical protein